ncbi:MAG TPA: ribbon-helix-helix protein, CopG family [Acidobacteriota bacterium]|jgi:hypothetical protein
MQVSIYLNQKIVRKVDKIARSERRSRSKIIEHLLESSLQGVEAGGPMHALAGKWKDRRPAKQIIREIYQDRGRNRRSERMIS